MYFVYYFLRIHSKELLVEDLIVVFWFLTPDYFYICLLVCSINRMLEYTICILFILYCDLKDLW